MENTTLEQRTIGVMSEWMDVLNSNYNEDTKPIYIVGMAIAGIVMLIVAIVMYFIG